MLSLILTCKSKDSVYDQFKVIDGGTWNIMVIKSYDKYLVGSAEYEILHGNYLYTDFKHKKVLIEIQDKEIQGDFIIKKNDENYEFIISDASDPLFNKKYDIVLKAMTKSSFSTHYSLMLRSDNLLIAAKKIQMGNELD